MCISQHFIQSSVDGHLGCFHVSTIVNSAAMNCMYIVWTMLSINTCLRVGLQAHMVALF